MGAVSAAAASHVMTSNLEAEKNPLVQILRAWDPAAVAETNEFRGELTIELARENALRVAEFLRHEKGLEFDFLSDISAVDRFPMEPRFELNYHLLSIERSLRLRLRVRLPGSRVLLHKPLKHSLSSAPLR